MKSGRLHIWVHLIKHLFVQPNSTSSHKLNSPVKVAKPPRRWCFHCCLRVGRILHKRLNRFYWNLVVGVGDGPKKLWEQIRLWGWIQEFVFRSRNISKSGIAGMFSPWAFVVFKSLFFCLLVDFHHTLRRGGAWLKENLLNFGDSGF